MDKCPVCGCDSRMKNEGFYSVHLDENGILSTTTGYCCLNCESWFEELNTFATQLLASTTEISLEQHGNNFGEAVNY